MQVLDVVIDVEEQLLLSLVLDVGHNWITKLYLWGQALFRRKYVLVDYINLSTWTLCTQPAHLYIRVKK